MLALYETRYFDFTAKHFPEKAAAEHDLKRSDTWTKNRLQEAGKLDKATRRASSQTAWEALGWDDVAPGRVSARVGSPPT